MGTVSGFWGARPFAIWMVGQLGGFWAAGVSAQWVEAVKKCNCQKVAGQKESENAEQVDVAVRLRCLFALIANGIFSNESWERGKWKWMRRTYTLQADQPHHHHYHGPSWGGWLINCRKIFDLFYFWSPKAHSANRACCGQQYAFRFSTAPLLPLRLLAGRPCTGKHF